MFMKASFYLFLIFALISTGCLIGNNFAGNDIDKNGFLHSTFFLLPAGYLSCLVALLALIAFLITKFHARFWLIH